MTTPVIEAGDITGGGQNGTTNPFNITIGAYADGDLIICCLATDSNGGHPDPFPDGLNAESPVVIERDITLDILVSAWYYIADGSSVGGTISITTDTAEQQTWFTIIVPAGEFDAATPIDSSGSNTGSGSNVPSAAFSASANAAAGRVVNFMGIDIDPLLTTPTGWTERAYRDDGATAGGIATRDAAATDSESVASANWTISNDSSASITFIVSEPSAGGGDIVIEVPVGPVW